MRCRVRVIESGRPPFRPNALSTAALGRNRRACALRVSNVGALGADLISIRLMHFSSFDLMPFTPARASIRFVPLTPARVSIPLWFMPPFSILCSSFCHNHELLFLSMSFHFSHQRLPNISPGGHHIGMYQGNLLMERMVKVTQCYLRASGGNPFAFLTWPNTKPQGNPN